MCYQNVTTITTIFFNHEVIFSLLLVSWWHVFHICMTVMVDFALNIKNDQSCLWIVNPQTYQTGCFGMSAIWNCSVGPANYAVMMGYLELVEPCRCKPLGYFFFICCTKNALFQELWKYMHSLPGMLQTLILWKVKLIYWFCVNSFICWF